MAPEARSKRSSLQAKSTASTDWLPYQDEPKYTSKSIRTRDLKPIAQHDWFASLALAMKQHGDDVQSKMVVKLYYFLLDFIPQALNEGYRHISGKNVMEYLLCHAGEYQFSRHRVCKNAETSFKNLEKWMHLGNDWQDALKNATDLAYQHGCRAPALHCPAGMLAILVIAYPDSDKVVSFKQRIKRLQIDWMMDQPRDKLSVREGFWKGVNNCNISTVFIDEKLKQAANGVTMLADYDKLFGSEFSHCRNDMRPYLQDWASHLTLGGSFTNDQRQSADSLSIDGDNSSIGSHRSSSRDDPEDILPPLSISKLRRHLNPTAKDPKELGDWLIGNLAQEADGSIFSTWCRYWEGRIDKATNYQEQMIIQSLFIQSLRRIESLDSAPEAAPVAEVYALLDTGDGTSAFNQGKHEALQSLDDLQVYKACTQSNHQLRQLIESGDNKESILVWAEKCFTQQVSFFSDFSRTSPFFAQYKKVVKLDTWRIYMLVDGFENLNRVNRGELTSWRNNQKSLLTDNAVATLMLTFWQIRLLFFLGGDCQTVLTDWQYLVFR